MTAEVAPGTAAAGETDEKFELVKHLGTGGFAQTYMARVLDQERVEEYGTDTVALKLPLNREKAEALRKEIKCGITMWLQLKTLDASHVCRFLDFDIFRGDFAMAMEFVSGGSLRDRLGKIGRQKALPVEVAVEITKGILAGLYVIHEASVFHRDIKPENILMDGDTPKISDFGISKILQSNEFASTTTGTLFYMSPEILEVKGASFTSDIWSVGVTLYEMLTGELPFGTKTTPMGRMIDLIRSHEPKEPKSLRKDIPAELNKLVLKALDKDPERRFASSQDMIGALEGLSRSGEEELERELAAARELLQSDEKKDAVEAKLKALAKSYPNEGRVYQYLGELYNGAGRYNDAIQAFKKGIRHDPQNAVLRWDLALAYQTVGKRDAAIRSLEKALSLGLDPSLERYALRLMKALKSG